MSGNNIDDTEFDNTAVLFITYPIVHDISCWASGRLLLHITMFDCLAWYNILIIMTLMAL